MATDGDWLGGEQRWRGIEAEKVLLRTGENCVLDAKERYARCELRATVSWYNTYTRGS